MKQVDMDEASNSLPRCSRCKTHQDATEFTKCPSKKSGLSSWCKTCQAAHRAVTRERTNAYNRWYRSRGHRVTPIKTGRPPSIYNYSHRNLPGVAERQAGAEREHHLWKKFRLRRSDYDILLANQNGRCAICFKPPKGGRPLAVDHDHACCSGRMTCGGCIRGLLCETCNKALHWVENTDWRHLAESYLRTAKEGARYATEEEQGIAVEGPAEEAGPSGRKRGGGSRVGRRRQEDSAEQVALFPVV